MQQPLLTKGEAQGADIMAPSVVKSNDNGRTDRILIQCRDYAS